MRIPPQLFPATLFLSIASSAISQTSPMPQDPYAEATQHFTYDQTLPLDLHRLSTQPRPNATLEDITYASPNGGTVPAYLILPAAPGKHSAILWAHWLLPNSPTANRDEFLPEALALAQSGVVSLLIDAPQARPNFKPTPNPALITQQVVDLRRALDLLAALPDIDPARIAFVGHSWDANVGAILDAVETRPGKRPSAFVFMSGPQSTLELILQSDNPRMVELRKRAPAADLEQALHRSYWHDPATYAAHLGPSPALFQYGTQDEEWVPLTDAKDYFASASGPKQVKYYESGHALDAQARADRIAFLSQHLGFTPPPPAVIEAIPQTK